MRQAGILFAAHFILQIGLGALRVAIRASRKKTPARKPNKASE